MTVLEATNKLVEFFAKNDVFELATDFNQVILISDTEGDKATILAALDGLEQSGLIIKKHFNTRDYWVLLRPLVFETQNVTLPLNLALEVSRLLNSLDPKQDSRSNPLAINAQDILDLLVLAKKR
jgi:hypothetical protein